MAAQSKNSRTIAKPAGAYSEQGDMKRFVALGAGHCYLNDPRNGKTLHLKVNSEAFNTAIADIAATGYDMTKVYAEMEALAVKYPDVPWAAALAAARTPVVTAE